MPSVIPESFGRRVSALRNGLGLTQQEVAGRLALSRNAVSEPKRDRLPLVAPRFTRVAARLASLDRELSLIERLDPADAAIERATVVDELEEMERESFDPDERAQLAAAILYVGATSARNRS
jgi:transcriptional regulator with XRE-family HTH domain